MHDETGLGPGRRLIRRRVAHARHLLEGVDLSVGRIAGRVGFAAGASPRRYLHAAVGVLPARLPQDVPGGVPPLAARRSAGGA